MFGRYTLSLGRIYDTVIIREGGTSLPLHVNADPNRMSLGIIHAQKRLSAIGDNSTEEEMKDAAMYFAGVIFGEDQAEKLLDYYHGDAGCVVAVCAKYFTDRLRDKITRAQKKQKP